MPPNSGEQNVSRAIGKLQSPQGKSRIKAQADLDQRYRDSLVQKLETEFKKLAPLVSADQAANDAFLAFFVSPPQNITDRGAFWAYLLEAARNQLRNQIEAENAQKRRPKNPMKHSERLISRRRSRPTSLTARAHD